MHWQTARSAATGYFGEAQKNYPKQQLRENKVCASYLTSNDERETKFLIHKYF